MRWLHGIIDAMEMNLGKFWEMVWDRQDWRAAVHGFKETDSTGRLNKKTKFLKGNLTHI